MADTDIFTIGSTVTVTTAVQEEITGEVMAFDQKARLLVLKKPASNSKTTTCNIHTIYMNKVKSIHIADEPESSTTPPPLPEISISVLRKRLDKAVQERKRINASMNCKAPKDGQQLYLSIAKCFNDTRWNDNADIVVEEGVFINPPYTAACVHAIDPSNPQSPRFVELIQKMVNRYHKEKERQPEPSTADLSKAPPPIIESASEASAQR